METLIAKSNPNDSVEEDNLNEDDYVIPETQVFSQEIDESLENDSIKDETGFEQQQTNALIAGVNSAEDKGITTTKLDTTAAKIDGKYA